MAFPKIFAIGAALGLASCSGGNGGTPKIAVSDAWARATVPGQTSAAAYLQVANDGDGADTLAGVSAEVGDATIHSSSIYGGIMRMRSLASVAIPAHSVVRFQPSGNHIMITGVNKPLAAGSSFELKLHFKNSGDRAVAVEVRSATTSGMQM